jgi:hypothetical protein
MNEQTKLYIDNQIIRLKLFVTVAILLGLILGYAMLVYKDANNAFERGKIMEKATNNAQNIRDMNNRQDWIEAYLLPEAIQEALIRARNAKVIAIKQGN